MINQKPNLDNGGHAIQSIQTIPTMTKTLIIHPNDRSTDFLKKIYSKISDATIITSGNRGQVNEEIMKHDRIMMMGHGSPWGLFSVGQFAGIEGKYNGYIIDHDTVSLLNNLASSINSFELSGSISGLTNLLIKLRANCSTC